MKTTDTDRYCPECKVDFLGEPIPQAARDAGYYGDSTHYSKRIAIVSPIRDRATHWLCPECGYRWERT